MIVSLNWSYCSTEMIPLPEQEDGGPIPVDAQLLAIAQLVKNCCAVSEMATLPCVFRVCVCVGAATTYLGGANVLLLLTLLSISHSHHLL